MDICWRFAVLLILTLVALLTFSQPLFQSTPADMETHTLTELAIGPEAAIVRGVPQHHLNTFLTSKASLDKSTGKTTRTFGLRLQDRRQRWTRKLIQSHGTTVWDTPQTKVACSRKRQNADRIVSGGNIPTLTRSGIPRRSVSAHFESDRMVPTGPNPLHNSNRSQVIFP